MIDKSGRNCLALLLPRLASNEFRRLDLTTDYVANMELFKYILWQTIEGDAIPFPGPRPLSIL